MQIGNSPYKLNQVYQEDMLVGMAKLPEKCAQLIIADPPYFEVKGEFDFVWDSFEDYLKDVEKWAKACKRVLADNGTLFWWGDKKRIAYSQVILDKYFNLENSLMWRKIDSMQYQYYSPDLARTFNTHNERLLMYSNEIDQTGLELIKNDTKNFIPLRKYFEDMQKWMGVTKSDIVKKIGGKADHCFRWGSSQWDMPTTETYQALIDVYSVNEWSGFKSFESTDNSHDQISKEYETLREGYESQRRFFHNPQKLEEVLEYSQESYISKVLDHDTIKPEKLTRSLILTCSRPNDLVVIPFAGSGTECAMSAKEGRQFIGFDLVEDYVKMSNDRASKIIRTPSLFTTPPVQNNGSVSTQLTIN